MDKKEKIMKFLILAAIIIGLFMYIRYDWTRGAGVSSEDDLQTYFMQKWAEQTRKEAQEREQNTKTPEVKEEKSTTSQ